MPNLTRQIPETMRKQGIPEEVMAQFTFPQTTRSEDVMELVNQMDKLLTKEQILAVMEQQGCCKTGKGPAAHREFGRNYADKSVAERIALFDEVATLHKAPCRLNDDGTLSVYWGDNGSSNNQCPCGIIKKLPESVEVPRSFCGCCGGHIRNNYQKSLGVKLRLKEVVSSASSSGGKRRCEFLYDIIG